MIKMAMVSFLACSFRTLKNTHGKGSFFYQPFFFQNIFHCRFIWESGGMSLRMNKWINDLKKFQCKILTISAKTAASSWQQIPSGAKWWIQPCFPSRIGRMFWWTYRKSGNNCKLNSTKTQEKSLFLRIEAFSFN